MDRVYSLSGYDYAQFIEGNHLNRRKSIKILLVNEIQGVYRFIVMIIWDKFANVVCHKATASTDYFSSEFMINITKHFVNSF